MSRKRIKASAVCIVVLLPVLACRSNAPEGVAPPAGWPSALESFTMAWTAEPGVDLVTDGAVIAARAYVESSYLASITNDAAYLYPGFADAVEPNQTSGPPGTSDLQPEIGTSGPNVYVGTVGQRVMNVARADRDVTVSVCTFTYGAAIERPNGRYNAIVGQGFVPGPGIYPMRIGLRTPDIGQASLPAQQGPSRAPFDDVFGGWKITSHQGGYLASTSRWPEYDSDVAACTAKADAELANRHVSPTEAYPIAEFPTLAATPGWPDDATVSN